jgi:uncharacterized protein involved in exopolysaccharide biosynthesis
MITVLVLAIGGQVCYRRYREAKYNKEADERYRKFIANQAEARWIIAGMKLQIAVIDKCEGKLKLLTVERDSLRVKESDLDPISAELIRIDSEYATTKALCERFLTKAEEMKMRLDVLYKECCSFK